jgi:hypothetical protein
MAAKPLPALAVARTQMQTPEQRGKQFIWELNNIKNDLEAILQMSAAETVKFAPTLVSRINVASARLKLFRKTLE